MLRAGHAAVACRALRLGGSAVARYCVRTFAAPALAGPPPPLPGFRRAPHRSRCVPAARVAGLTLSATAPARVLAVVCHAPGRLLLTEWGVSTQRDLDRHLAHGLLWHIDTKGNLIRSVAVLSELADDPGAKYYFRSVGNAFASESALAALLNRAVGSERERTRAIAADALVQQTFGVVSPLLDGEPFDFDIDAKLFLQVDGLLGSSDGAWVLLHSVRLTAGMADVFDAIGDASKLHNLLRHPAVADNMPASLAAYSNARVHAFLSTANFLPGALEFAVRQGITPLECSGVRCHVPLCAASSLPGSIK